MKYKLYLELASRLHDSRVLDLLRFPSGLLPEGEWLGRWWSQGGTKRSRSRDRENLLQKIASAGVNELELKWRPLGPVKQTEAPQLTEIWQEFFPSPASSAWAQLPTEELASHSDERSRRNFRNIESVLSTPYAHAYPSTLQCFFELECPGQNLSEEELQEQSIRWILSALPQTLATTEIVGYGCVHGTCRQMLMVISLEGPELEQLGNKFENIYPILIGPRESCQGLASVSGGRASLVPSSERAPYAILSINPKDVKALLADPEVKKWTLTKRLPKPDDPRVVVVPPKAISNRPQ